MCETMIHKHRWPMSINPTGIFTMGGQTFYNKYISKLAIANLENCQRGFLIFIFGHSCLEISWKMFRPNNYCQAENLFSSTVSFWYFSLSLYFSVWRISACPFHSIFTFLPLFLYSCILIHQSVISSTFICLSAMVFAF